MVALFAWAWVLALARRTIATPSRLHELPPAVIAGGGRKLENRGTKLCVAIDVSTNSTVRTIPVKDHRIDIPSSITRNAPPQKSLLFVFLESSPTDTRSYLGNPTHSVGTVWIEEVETVEYL